MTNIRLGFTPEQFADPEYTENVYSTIRAEMGSLPVVEVDETSVPGTVLVTLSDE